MPEAGPGRQPQDELIGLLTERDALHRRLAWVDTQVTHLQLNRQDAMVRRLASLEEALVRWAPAPTHEPRVVVTGPPPVPFAERRGEAGQQARIERIAAAPMAAYTAPVASAPVPPSIQDAPAVTQPVHPEQLTGTGTGPSPTGPAPTSIAPGPMAPPAWSRPGFMPKLLALVGAAVTLIGVAFLLILAAQYGLFGPLARTISAALLGGVLVALAFLVRHRDPGNVGAPILGATGVAAAFLSVVTATVIYGWLPPVVGVGLAALIGLGGMVLARLWDNEWVGLVSVLGSLLLAVYVGAGPEPVVTAGLMLVMTAVTLWFERGTGWRLFPFARVLPTVMVLLQLTWNAGSLRPDQLWWLVALTVCLALLALLSALIAPVHPPVGQAIALALLAPMVAPAALAAPQLSSTVGAACVLAVLAGVYCVCGFLPRVDERVRSAAVPIGAGFALLAAFTATEHRYFVVLSLGFAVVYLAVAARIRSGVNLIVGGILGVVGILQWLPLLAFSLDQESAVAAGPEQILQSLVGIAVVVYGTMAATRWFAVRPRWSIYLSWSMATAMGSVAIIHLSSWIGVLAGNPGAGFQSGQALVTTAWMVLCVVFLQRGLAAKEDFDIWLHLALAVAALAVAKLFLLDLGMLNAVARVGVFLAVGLLLLFVGTRYAKAWERAHGDDLPDLPVMEETENPVAPAEDVAAAGTVAKAHSERSTDT